MLSIIKADGYFGLILFGKKIINRGDPDNVFVTKHWIFELNKPGERTWIPHIYLSNDSREVVKLGKRPGWTKEFTIKQPTSVPGSLPRALISEYMTGSYCDGTALRVYADGRTEEVEVWFILEVHGKDGKHAPIMNYTPKRARDGTYNSRPEPVLNLMFELLQGIDTGVREYKSTLTN